MIDLSGQVILVTGASRGIGACSAETLCKAGAAVVLHYGQAHEEAAAIATRLGSDRVLPIAVDLRQPGAARELWNQALAWRGVLHTLVNNAAVMPSAPVDAEWEVWSQAWQDTLQVNLVAVADLCRCAIGYFKGHGGGTLINIASRAAFRGDGPDFMPYAASKGGIVSLTRTIARGFAQDGIFAYTLAPGFVHTERIAQVMAERGPDYVTRDIPLQAPADPQDVANLIAFLAAGLAPHATGATFDVNGASYFH